MYMHFSVTVLSSWLANCIKELPTPLYKCASIIIYCSKCCCSCIIVIVFICLQSLARETEMFYSLSEYASNGYTLGYISFVSMLMCGICGQANYWLSTQQGVRCKAMLQVWTRIEFNILCSSVERIKGRKEMRREDGRVAAICVCFIIHVFSRPSKLNANFALL